MSLQKIFSPMKIFNYFCSFFSKVTIVYYLRCQFFKLHFFVLRKLWLWLTDDSTSCRPLQSVIILVINKPILLIILMITDQIRFHSVLLLLYMGEVERSEITLNTFCIQSSQELHSCGNLSLTQIPYQMQRCGSFANKQEWEGIKEFLR